MVTLAKANGITVIIGSILPADHFSGRPVCNRRQIAELNGWLRSSRPTAAWSMPITVHPGRPRYRFPQPTAATGFTPTQQAYAVLMEPNRAAR
ncbi:MAG: hypothetical protein R3E03_09230 [Novosphingobium sp.]